MDYIKTNNLPFTKAVDILTKIELDFTSEDAETRELGFKNSKVVVDYFKEFYERRMLQVTKIVSKMIGISGGLDGDRDDNLDENDRLDKIYELEQGYYEFEDLEDIYVSHLEMKAQRERVHNIFKKPITHTIGPNEQKYSMPQPRKGFKQLDLGEGDEYWVIEDGEPCWTVFDCNSIRNTNEFATREEALQFINNLKK
jgi:hypothetical protein